MIHSGCGVIHAPEHLLLTRNFVALRRRPSLQQLADFRLERGRQRLVSIQQQHPVVGSRRQRHLLLRAVAHEFVLGDARAVTLADSQGGVGAEGIQHDDFIRPLDAFQARRQGTVVVVGSDKY